MQGDRAIDESRESSELQSDLAIAESPEANKRTMDIANRVTRVAKVTVRVRATRVVKRKIERASDESR